MRYKIALGICWIAALWSCNDGIKSTKAYYNIDSLIDTQVEYLTKAKAFIVKTASIDSARDESKFTPDSTVWAHELEVFRHLDEINKSIYADAYQVIDGENDPHSNLTIRVYRAKREAPITELKMYYYNTFDRLKRIEATVKETNALYYTRRKLVLELDDFDSKTVLHRYAIQGIQKMILSDSVRFSISSKIMY